MLPKPEKISKKSASKGEQLDLVKTIDEGTQVEKRRLWVIILLISTIGLSIIFSIYRFGKHMVDSRDYPKLSLPQVTLDKPEVNVPGTIDAQIQAVVADQSWSLKLLSLTDNNPQLLWSKNADTLTMDPLKLQSELSKTPIFVDSVIAPVLPQGLSYHEKVITDQAFIEHDLLITLPKKQLLVISRLNSSNVTQFKEKLPLLIDALYWYAIKLK